MKYIDRLLQGASVEWRPLGEVAEVVTDFTAAGSFASNAENVKYLKEPSYALLVRTTDLKQGFANSDNFVYVDEHAFNYLWRVNLDKESLILPNVGNCGEVYYSVPTELPHTHCVLGPNALLLRSSMVENRFLYYWFQGSDFQYKLSKITSSTGQTKFNKTNLKKLEIPIPPVAVQEEVVRVLDKFTALEAELEVALSTELDCRKRQYGYYRDALLTFDLSPSDGLCHSPLFPAPFAVEWHPLGEVGEIYGGLTGKNKDDFKSGDALYIPYKNIFDNICVSSSHLEPVVVASTEKQNEVRYGDLLFTASSETPEEVGMSSAVTSHFETPVYLNSFCFGVRFNEDVTLIPEFSKFLFRSTQMRRQISRTASGVTRFNVSKSRFKKIGIPIPPLAVQEQIVEILDKFDTLVNSISEGLPREIELRRKQYEYYRDALLSFEPLTSNL